MLVEVCAGSLQDCLVAQKCGADRIELNQGLHLGGLTPSLSTLCLAKEKVSLPIICMVRPRGAGFCYSLTDRQVMFHEAKLLLENGADGIAFGFLTKYREIDRELTQQMIELIHAYQKEAVFHRAFDCVRDFDEAFDLLISLQCDRVLTSGGENNAEQGIKRLKEWQQLYGKQIELLMGAGINSSNIKKLQKETTIQQCHASFKEWFFDASTSGNGVSYRYVDREVYDGVSETKLIELLDLLKKGE